MGAIATDQKKGCDEQPFLMTRVTAVSLVLQTLIWNQRNPAT